MFRTLYFWVIVAVIAGALLGHFAPDTAVTFKPLGDIFIKLIKMMIAPVIFCTVVLGIAGMRSLKNAGRVGFKSLVYFEVVSTLALVIGLIVINWVQPGTGMHIDPASLDTKSVQSYATTATSQGTGVVDFILHIIPGTITDAFASGNILQVLLVALLFACAMIALGNKSYQILQIIQQFSDILFKMIHFIVLLAPFGAFGAMAFTVGKYGVDALTQLAELMLCFYLTCVVFIAVVLGALMRVIGLRLWPLLRALKEEIFIVLGTSSSETVLPRLIEKMEKFGCSKSVVGMAVPTGYSFNLDGTAIYLTMAAVFLAQALDMHLTFAQELTLIFVLMLTSKGAAGVTGSGFVVLAGTLATIGHIPVESIALILGIDRFMSEARAVTNFIGNAVATMVVSKWEKALDMPTAKKALKI